MKTSEEIYTEIAFLHSERTNLELEHRNLDKYSLLSGDGEGNKLRTRINKITGMLTALAWVVDDTFVSPLHK